ncbi:MAG: ATP-dependent DNA helicase RecG [Alphaproteobacteria bacterium]|nr:ATP-dependent DNA helicase RecG [Alphaproteobacteria bacterium]
MRDPLLYPLFAPVSHIKGVGSSASEALMRLLPQATQRDGGGLPIVRDLLFHLPTGMIDRRQTFPLAEAPDGAVATFVVTVEEHLAPKNSRYSKKPYKVVCSNDSGDITLVFFNAREDYIKQALPVGQQRVISGRIERFDYQLQMPHPDIILPVSQLAEVQKTEPVYPLTIGLTSRRIAKLVEQALEKLPELPEWREPKPAISFKQALLQLHHPEGENALAPDHPAKLRLVQDEILAHQLQLALLRRKMQQQEGVVITGDGTLTEPLIRTLPYRLTRGQEQVLADIRHDLASGKRMARLLQGDVGSGKTIVALLAMLQAAEQKLQSAFMAPTELIARQHYEVISKLADNAVLLTGSVKGKERAAVLEKIASGEAKIVIGTHALFQDKVEFNKLSLAVIDEQHRFGVAQRMALSQKGDAPHLLHMTATPIPRSLTMMIYGDMECSLLTEKPKNRKPITTRIIPRSRTEEVLTRLKAALDRGEKAYWICPLVDNPAVVAGSGRIPEHYMRDTRKDFSLAPGMTEYRTPPFGGDSDIAAVQTRHREFSARFGNIVGLVHGQMKAELRNEAMQQFASGATTLLVATTVVEVGVDVQDATIIVIEQAERFGLSQLHQLRGRVGRGEKESACVLLADDRCWMMDDGESSLSSNIYHPTSGALERLCILRATEDGFKIAEEDLKLRGGGELLGLRQSGAMQTVFVDIALHHALIASGRDEAKTLLEHDPELSGERGKAAQLLLQLFERETPLD